MDQLRVAKDVEQIRKIQGPRIPFVWIAPISIEDEKVLLLLHRPQRRGVRVALVCGKGAVTHPSTLDFISAAKVQKCPDTDLLRR